MKRVPFAAPLLACALFDVTGACAQSFTFTNITVPNATNTYVFGFAPGGRLVGSFYDTNNNLHGYIMRRNGTFRQLDVKGASGTQITAASAKGYLVQALEPQNATQSFLLSPAGTYTPIAVPNAHATAAWAMNDAGVVVGSYVPNGSTITAAFIDQGGKYTTYAQPNTSLTAYYGINSKGVIAGSFQPNAGSFQSTGFTLAGGKMSLLQVPGVSATIVQGINDAGEVVGYVRDINNVSNAGFVHKGDKFTSFGVGAPDYVWGWAIDNHGNIAGFDVLQYEAVAGFVGKVE
jgi:hypothetical protein